MNPRQGFLLPKFAKPWMFHPGIMGEVPMSVGIGQAKLELT